jgi:esterase
MTLHYQSYGDQDDAPLLILHGLFGSSDNWKSIAKLLSQHYWVITVDLRNHGLSFHADAMSYELMAEDINNLLSELNITKAVFIGHSMGGKVVMKLGLLFPEKFAKQIIVDMSPRVYIDQHMHIIDALRSVDLTKVGSRSEADRLLSEKIKEKSVRQFLLLNLKTDKSNVFFWKINLESLHNNYQQLLENIVSEQDTISIPSYFIRGGQSDYITDNDRVEIKKNFQHVEIITIEHVGHWIHAEAPTVFLQTVNEILTS